MKSSLIFLTMLLLSTAAFAQWADQTSGVTTALYSVSAVNNSICWIGGAGGVVIRTTDGGTNWTNVGGAGVGSAAVYAIYALDANNALCTTSPSTGTFIYKTTNGGTTWTQTLTQTGGFGDGIWMTSPTNAFFYGDPVGGRWTLFRSTNGGTTWDSTGLYLASGADAGWNNGLFMLGSNIWFGTNGTKVWYSSNNGSTWTAQATTGQPNSYCVWFNSATNGMTGGTDFMATTNGGTNWTAVTVPGTGNISGISGEGNNWYVCRQATAIYMTTNNGVAWTTAFTAPAGSYYHLSKARSGNAVWAVRSNGGITKGIDLTVPVEFTSFSASVSNGTVALSWKTATETNNRGFDIERKKSGGEYTAIGFVQGNGTVTSPKNYSFSEPVDAGKYTYRLKQIDFNGKYSYSNEIEAEVIPTAFNLSQNYPNPFNPSTRIDFAIPGSEMVTLTVYNELGQKVTELLHEQKEAGNHSVTFNAAGLTSGMYYYKINAGSYSAVKKSILMK